MKQLIIIFFVFALFSCGESATDKIQALESRQFILVDSFVRLNKEITDYKITRIEFNRDSAAISKAIKSFGGTDPIEYPYIDDKGLEAKERTYNRIKLELDSIAIMLKKLKPM